MNAETIRDYYFALFPSEEGYPIEFSITELLEFTFDFDSDYSNDEKLSIIDGLILDIQDYRAKIDGNKLSSNQE